MRYATARAMQIATLDLGQIDRLHEVEKAVSRCLMPYEMQSIFGISEMKGRYELPDNDEGLSTHKNRIEAELKRLELEKKCGYISEIQVENTHKFDMEVYGNKGQIVWEYSGGGKRKSSVFNKLSSFLF